MTQVTPTLPPAFTTLIESRPGASGEIGSRLVAEGDANSCRLLVAQSNQLTTNQLGIPNAINPSYGHALGFSCSEFPVPGSKAKVYSHW